MSLVRFAVAVVILFAGLLVLALGLYAPQSNKDLTVWTLIFTGPFFIIFCTEKAGSAVGIQTSSRRFPALIESMLVRNPNRGLLLLLSSLLWLCACNLASRLLVGSELPFKHHQNMMQVAILCMFSFIYVALPSMILAHRRFDRLPEWSRPVTLVVSVITSWFVFAAAGDYLVPFTLVEEVRLRGGMTEESQTAVASLIIVFVVTLLATLPRMIRGPRG